MSSGSDVWTVARVRALKGRRFACVTATDAVTARWADEAGLPLVLVGDSLAMTVLGHPTTLPATMSAMLHHAAAVVRGTNRALVIADMPFLSYQVSDEEALHNAGRFLQEAGVAGVKMEGGRVRAATVRRLVDNGVPVLGHIGLLPQSVRAMGGYAVQGRTASDAARLLADARALEAAGVFAIVLEGMPAAVARRITASVKVPTIGIGAGPHCDGQILVLHDLLGMTAGRAPKFVRRYAELGAEAVAALQRFRHDVETGRFPTAEHCY
ncbi:MAG: 3-methyl-2-oxobutanoate hydroxymethyltransferase [Kiritimatiellae bacterium]|nr:3-methyl-2-oxobutanoate hydroxymethyltransferase [Kiritimatiellia bacterium]